MSGTGDVRVLHVDDEPEFADVAAMHLERVDDELCVTTATSARDGLERLRAEPIDCVVSDHDMPGTNGLEFLRAVREEFPGLPFILFTGKGNEEIASDAISAGVTEYLQKDVGTDQYTVLANRIRRAVGEKRAKSALEESERQLSTLISNLPGMVYRARNEAGWPMELVSDGAVDLVGYDSATIESGDVSWGSLIHDEDESRIDEQVARCIAAEEPFEVSYRVTTADGETRWMWERGRVVDTDDGVELLEGFITDITAREERERELQREREFTESLVDAIDDVFYLLSTDGALLRWNDTGREVTGYSDEELASMTALDLVPESAREKVRENIQQALERGQSAFEAPLLTKDGTEIPHEFRGSVIHDRTGDRLGVAGIARDITDQRERERELEQYRTLVQNVGDPMYVLDADGRIQMVNDAMVAHLGYDRGDIVGSEPRRFVPSEDTEAATETLRQLAETPGETWATMEMRTIDAEGNRTLNENKVATLRDADGHVVGSVGVMRDVTERSQREWELERYETIVEAVGDPVYTLDADGVFTFVNEAIEPMTGYSPGELVGQHIGEIMTDEDVARGDERIQELLAAPETDSTTLEMDVVTKWGERIPSENNLALLPSRDGAFTGTAGVIRDIHERKEREQRLAEFASVVSHDLRNPLNVVQGRLQLAIETADISHLDAAAEAADRMEQLIQELLTLARQGDTVGTLEPIDLRAAAEQAWANVETAAATLSVTGTRSVEADPERLRELLENLFRNSVEHGSADAQGVTRPVSRRPAEQRATHEGLAVAVGALSDDDATGFYVADNGPGIDAEERESIFDRGYTTADEGTGFGLAIVEDIATAHGWTVEVTESDAGGARFEFTTTRGGP